MPAWEVRWADVQGHKWFLLLRRKRIRMPLWCHAPKYIPFDNQPNALDYIDLYPALVMPEGRVHAGDTVRLSSSSSCKIRSIRLEHLQHLNTSRQKRCPGVYSNGESPWFHFRIQPWREVDAPTGELPVTSAKRFGWRKARRETGRRLLKIKKIFSNVTVPTKLI